MIRPLLWVSVDQSSRGLLRVRDFWDSIVGPVRRYDHRRLRGFWELEAFGWEPPGFGWRRCRALAQALA